MAAAAAAAADRVQDLYDLLGCCHYVHTTPGRPHDMDTAALVPGTNGVYS